MLFPFIASLLLSFTKWDMMSGIGNIKWVAFDNFAKLLKSPRFYAALLNNLLIVAVCVPATLAISLVAAYILNEKVYFRKTIRLLYFVPYICNIIAVSAIWRSLFRTPDGPVSQMLAALGAADPPRWFADSSVAIVPILALNIWTGIGYDMIIYMAALQGVPKELREAGEIDGAVGAKQFWHITIPLLSPTTYFLVVTRMIAMFQIFSAIKVITQGGPGKATTVLVYEVYTEAFTNYNFGYASSIALVLFVIIMAITMIQQRLQSRWVVYS
jgi:multiple sugar transport system permease protein